MSQEQYKAAPKKREEEKSPLEKIYDQIDGLTHEQLLFGLTILIKDAHEFVCMKGYRTQAVEHFRNLYLLVVDEDRFYWECYGDTLFITLRKAGLPHGFADRADREVYNISEIGDDDKRPLGEHKNIWTWLAHFLKTEDKNQDKRSAGEWLRYAGWSFLKKFSTQNKAFIYEDYGLTAATAKSYPATAEKTIVLAKRLLEKVFDDETYWFPLAMFISLALIKSRFQTMPKN